METVRSKFIYYLKQAKMSVVDMRAVDTMEGLTCTAMFSRGPSPRPAKEIHVDLNHLRARLVVCGWYQTRSRKLF